MQIDGGGCYSSAKIIIFSLKPTVPVSFNVEHKEMLGHAKMILEKGQVAISFEDAVMAAFNRNHVSYNGSGAEPGVSMLKRYLGRYRNADNNVSFDDKRLWKFRYKL